MAVDKSDTNGLTVYTGGTMLYKTTNGGPVEPDPDNPTNWACIFNPVNYGFEFNDAGVSAIEANGNIVVLGLQGNPGHKGTLFLSKDGGSNWNEIVLNAGGVDVKDLLLTREAGADVVYAAVANNSIITAYGVFKISIADSNITHELTDTVNMQDLAAASDGSLYACGFDSLTNVALYSKAAGTVVWTAIPLNGYPTTKMAMFAGIPVVTVGLDGSSNEVPYMLSYEWVFNTNASDFRCAIYYMTTTGTNITWETSNALRYPADTHIKVMFWDDLVVGTTIGLYGQMFQPEVTTTVLTGDFDGDLKADPALYRTDTGNWYVKLSSMGYGLVTLSFGGAGYQAVNGDFDGDGKADPAVYQAITGTWYVQLSASGYTIVTLTNFGGVGYAAVTGDYDGDGLTDPAICGTASGDWQVAMSSLNYGLASASGFGGTGYTTVQENYDSDNRFDAAVYNNTNGNWTVLMSAQNYITATLWGFGGTGYTPVMGDFDGDGLADPAIYQESTGDWQVKLSGQQYATATLDGFGGSGTIVAAADYDGDGQADPIYLDESTGIWHVKLSASGYAEATADSGYTP